MNLIQLRKQKADIAEQIRNLVEVEALEKQQARMFEVAKIQHLIESRDLWSIINTTSFFRAESLYSSDWERDSKEFKEFDRIIADRDRALADFTEASGKLKYQSRELKRLYMKSPDNAQKLARALRFKPGHCPE